MQIKSKTGSAFKWSAKKESNWLLRANSSLVIIVFIMGKIMVLETAVQKQINFANDEAAIRARFQQMTDGWNHASDEIFDATFDEEAECVAFDGTRHKVGKATHSLREALFGKHMKGAQFVGAVESVRFLTSEIALVYASGGMISGGRQRRLSLERELVLTLVAIKRSGSSKWYFMAFHNGCVQPTRRKTGNRIFRFLTNWLLKTLG